MQFIRSIKYAVIFFHLSSSLISDEFPLDMLADLHRYRNTRSVSLIFTEAITSSTELSCRLVELIKYLSFRGVYTTAVYYKTLLTGVGSLHSNSMQTMFSGFGKGILSEISLLLKQKHCTWLLFVNRTILVRELMEGINIPLDTWVLIAQQTQYGFQLIQVYNIAHRQYVKQFGSWHQYKGLRISYARCDLQGVVMKATSVEGPPMTSIDKKSSKISGFIGDIWTQLEYRMNFTTQLRIPAENAYGSMAKNGSWNGMISILVKGESEVGVGDFTISASRAQAVDFTVPVAESTLTTFIRRSTNPDVGWTDFLNPFSANLWLAVLIIVVLITVSFKLIRLSVSFFFSSIFCQQGGAENWGNASRFLTFVTSITVLVLYAAYSANLISFLTVQIYILPFANLEELLERGDFQVDVTISSALFTELQETTNPVLKKVYERYIKNNQNLPVHTLSGLSRVCNKDQYAFVTSEPIANYMKKNLSCTIEMIPGSLMKETLALALTKNSSYLDIFNHNLLILREDGTLRRLETKIWPQFESIPENTWHGVEILNVISVFAMLSFGIFLSVLMIFLELGYHRYCKERISNYKCDRQNKFIP